ncbi:MAG TPA: capsule assembly Wzi family protein [Marinagarivorans sp.]
MFTRVLATWFATFGFSALAAASPWIDPGDARSRHHIQFLVDSGAITIPSNTWPLSWASVKQGIDSLNTSRLSSAQAWSLSYLQHELEKASHSAYTQSRSHIASSREILQGFEASSREEQELQAGLSFTGDTFAMRVTGTFVDEPSDGKRGRADGSYLALLMDNWAVGIGAVDRWWGPGWQSSTILSTNARPAPGIFLRRNRTDAFENPALSWLGQWQLTSFASELQDAKCVKDKPIMWGARASAVPLAGLELGLGRTAIWADKDLADSTLVQTGELAPSCQAYNAGNPNDEPNRQKQLQVTAFDVRYGLAIGQIGLALYGQVSQQRDRNNQQGSIALGGIDLSTSLFGTHSRLTLEGTNTISGFYDQPNYNRSYDSDGYAAGYRQYGKAFGASSDSDSEVISLAGQHYFPNGHSLTWRFSRADINRDGSAPANSAGSTFSANRTKVDNTQLQYRFPVTGRLMAEVGASHLDRDIVIGNETIESSLHFSLFHHW